MQREYLLLAVPSPDEILCPTEKASLRRLFAEEAAGHAVPAYWCGTISGRVGARPTDSAYCAGGGAGALLLPDASCSRSFFIRLTSTRPPLVRFGFSSEPVVGIGALPMPRT